MDKRQPALLSQATQNQCQQGFIIVAGEAHNTIALIAYGCAKIRSVDVNPSVVIAQADYLISYGTLAAKERLLQRVKEWVELGMPSSASFTLHVYPSNVSLVTHEHQWLVKRHESQFLWILDL